jgi:hypothetical protein
MGIYKANECVDCGLPCMGKACPHQNVIHKECDICGDEHDRVFKYENTIYCKDCLIDSLLMDGIIEEAEYEDECDY